MQRHLGQRHLSNAVVEQDARSSDCLFFGIASREDGVESW